MPGGSDVTSLFLGNNRKHRPVCAKTFSSWVKKVSMLIKHMSVGFPLGAATSAALAAGVSLDSILQVSACAGVSTPARHYFPPISLLRIDIKILCNILYRVSVSRFFIDKCQALTYIKSCKC